MARPKMRKLTDSEVATILHALRVVQHDGPIAEAGSCDHFDECEMLTDSEIDDLCEAINFDDVYIRGE